MFFIYENYLFCPFFNFPSKFEKVCDFKHCFYVDSRIISFGLTSQTKWKFILYQWLFFFGKASIFFCDFRLFLSASLSSFSHRRSERRIPSRIYYYISWAASRIYRAASRTTTPGIRGIRMEGPVSDVNFWWGRERK